MDYLVWLQNIRETCPGILLQFMVLVSEMSIYGLPVLICVMYWCVDKEFASVAMVNLSTGNLLNNFTKLCAAVYRPWVIDSRIHVAEEAVSTAEGYSFPSGHSTSCGAVFGTVLSEYGKKKTWVKVMCIAFLILVPVSRMFLGCHTIEDVVFGLALGLAMVFFGKPVVKWVNRSRRNELIYLAVCAAVSVLMIVYVENKTYPMDLAADGTLLVDPDTMKPALYGACGMMFGWVLCWPLERHTIKFAMPVSKKEAWVRGVLGVIVFAAVFFGLQKLLGDIDARIEHLIRYGVTVFTAGYLYPLSFKKINALLETKSIKTEA